MKQRSAERILRKAWTGALIGFSIGLLWSLADLALAPTGIIIGAALGAAIGAAGIVAGLTALTGALLYGGLAAAQYLLAPKQRVPELSQTARRVTQQRSRIPAQFVFGRTRLAGWMSWFADGEPNNLPVSPEVNRAIHQARFFHMVQVLSEGECDAIEAVWINGTRQRIQRARRGAPNTAAGQRTWSIYENQAEAPASAIIIPADDDATYGKDHTVGVDKDVPRWAIFPQLAADGLHEGGNDDVPQDKQIQTIATPTGTNAWGPQMRAQGKSYIYIILFQPGGSTDILWNSVPTVEVLLKGMKLRLPMDATGALSAALWTENAADAIYWLLLNRMGVPGAAIDLPSYIEAKTAAAALLGILDITRGLEQRALVSGRETVGTGDDAVTGSFLYLWGFGADPQGVQRFVYLRIGALNLGDGNLPLGIAQIQDSSGSQIGVIASNGSTTHLRSAWLAELTKPSGAAVRVGNTELSPQPAARPNNSLVFVDPNSADPKVVFWGLQAGTTPRFIKVIDPDDGTIESEITDPAMLPRLPEALTAAINAFIASVDRTEYLVVGTSQSFNAYPITYGMGGRLTFGQARAFTGPPVGTGTPINAEQLIGVVDSPAREEDGSRGVLILLRTGAIPISQATWAAGGGVLRTESIVAAVGNIPGQGTGTGNVRLSNVSVLPRPAVSPHRGYLGQYRTYTVNGLISADDDHSTLLKEMSYAISGGVVELNGRLHIRAGQERPAALHITDDDVIAVESLQPSPTYQQRINAATMSIAQSAAHDWTEASTAELSDAAWVAFDGRKLAVDIGTKAFVSQLPIAQMLLGIQMRQSRGGPPADPDLARRLQSRGDPAAMLMTLRLRPGPGARWYALAPFDRVMVTLAEEGFTSRTFEVLEVDINEDLSVTVALRDSPAGLYDLSQIRDLLPSQPIITGRPAGLAPPPDPTNVEARVAYVLSGGVSAQAQITVSWDNQGFASVVRLIGPEGAGEDQEFLLEAEPIPEDTMQGGG